MSAASRRNLQQKIIEINTRHRRSYSVVDIVDNDYQKLKKDINILLQNCDTDTCKLVNTMVESMESSFNIIKTALNKKGE